MIDNSVFLPALIGSAIASLAILLRAAIQALRRLRSERSGAADPEAAIRGPRP